MASETKPLTLEDNLLRRIVIRRQSLRRQKNLSTTLRFFIKLFIKVAFYFGGFFIGNANLKSRHFILFTFGVFFFRLCAKEIKHGSDVPNQIFLSNELLFRGFWKLAPQQYLHFGRYRQAKCEKPCKQAWSRILEAPTRYE